MSHVDVILVCLQPVDGRWELPFPQTGGVRRCVVGWLTSPTPVDGGLPREVAAILAGALVSRALVTFPAGTARLFKFVHTRQAEDVLPAFNAEYFDWTQRGQALFLSAVELPAPLLSEEHLRIALDSASLQPLAGVGVTGLVLPGVDGDVAGIYTLTDSLQDDLLAALRVSCERCGAKFLIVTQGQLADALARLPRGCPNK